MKLRFPFRGRRPAKEPQSYLCGFNSLISPSNVDPSSCFQEEFQYLSTYPTERFDRESTTYY